MSTADVAVPVDLLTDRALPPSAKLIWMVLQLSGIGNPPGPAALETTTGLSRKTVLNALRELTVAGWHSSDPAQHTHGAAQHRANQKPGPGRSADPLLPMPAALLTDHRIGIQGRILYAYLQWTPDFRHPVGQFTYVCLSELTGTSLNTVKRAVQELRDTGWLTTQQQNQKAPVQFSLSNPVVSRAETEVARARRRLEQTHYSPESLMKEWLSLLIDSDAFEDNARPGFLVNPFTDERLEFDRFYPPNVAFEYNGAQHYRETDVFSAEYVTAQRGRDYIKLGICVTRGIKLVVIHFHDLHLKSMMSKVGSLMPLRDLNLHEPLIAFLTGVSANPGSRRLIPLIK